MSGTDVSVAPAREQDLQPVLRLHAHLTAYLEALPAARESLARLDLQLAGLAGDTEDLDQNVRVTHEDLALAIASRGDRGAFEFGRRWIYGSNASDDPITDVDLNLAHATFTKRFAEAEPELWARCSQSYKWPEDGIQPALEAVARLTSSGD